MTSGSLGPISFVSSISCSIRSCPLPFLLNYCIVSESDRHLSVNIILAWFWSDNPAFHAVRHQPKSFFANRESSLYSAGSSVPFSRLSGSSQSYFGFASQPSAFIFSSNICRSKA